MTDPSPRPTARDWAMIATLGVTWGATFLGIKIALEGLAPVWVSAGRLTLAFALLASLAAFRPRDAGTDGRRRWPYLLVMGAVGAALPFFLLSWGQQHVSSGFAGVSMAAVALIVLPLSAALVPGEAMTVPKVAGIAVGFAGVVTLFWGRLGDGTDAAMLGRIACLGAAAGYAVASVATRLCPPMDPVRLAAAQIGIGMAILLPAALLTHGVPAPPPVRPLAALVVLALVPTAAANLLRVAVIRRAGPQFMSLTNYQVPVWAVVFGAAFLGEEVPGTLLLALALILGGIAVTRWPAIRARLAGRAAGA